jgi:uncharacterized protein YjbI with pentapeptide repeats
MIHPELRLLPLLLPLLSFACGGGAPAPSVEERPAALAAACAVTTAPKVHDATDIIQAESATGAGDAHGVTLFDAGISYVDHGEWVRFRAVDFGTNAAGSTFAVRMATPRAGNEVEIRLDCPTGRTIGSFTTQVTGPWYETYTTVQGQLANDAPISGVHDVYVLFDGSANAALCQTACAVSTSPGCQAAHAMGCGWGIGNFDWFQLVAGCPSGTKACNGACIPVNDCCPTAAVTALLETRRCDANCNYHGACLRNANLQGITITTSADFGAADMTGANVSGATIGGAGAAVTFEGALMSGTTFAGTAISGASANFHGANMAGANFAAATIAATGPVNLDANLTNANLAGANVSGSFVTVLYHPTGAAPYAANASLNGVDLTNAVLSASSDIQWVNAPLVGAELAGLTLQAGNSVNLTNLDLSGHDLSGVRLLATTGSVLLSSSNLDGANLQEAQCRNLGVTGGSMVNAILAGATFTGNHTYFNGVDMSGANLSGSAVSSSTFYFSAVTAVGVNLASLVSTAGTFYIESSDFTDADLTGAAFEASSPISVSQSSFCGANPADAVFSPSLSDDGTNSCL